MVVYCSQDFVNGWILSERDLSRPPVYGATIPDWFRVVSWLPTWNPCAALVSLDSFATYDLPDAVWAVPAGLVRWSGRYAHALVFDAEGGVRLVYELPGCGERYTNGRQ